MTHRILVAGVLLGLPVSSARAQAVEVILREDSTRAPVPGAIVRLLRERSPVAQGLSSEAGRVSLRAPEPGTFRLKIDRIGFRGTISEPFTLAAKQTRREEIDLGSDRIMLPTLVVQSERTCHTRLEEGIPAAALWEEIHKALTANVITERQLQLPLRVREFGRELDRTRVVQREWTASSRMARGAPFRAKAADTLATLGFVIESSGETTFAAPDAALLLSDEFVSTHCFKAVRGVGGELGLAFEPVRRRGVSDVQGTLWVDGVTGDLRHLEYSYTGLPVKFRFPGLGGRVEFLRLPTGALIVSHWYIRMPTVEVQALPNPTYVLVGYTDQGGNVEVGPSASRGDGLVRLSGSVFDSTTSRWLQGAVVRVRGATDSAVTDEAGRFELVVRTAGPQTVVVSHPKLGLIPDGSSRLTTLSAGQTITADFAVPPVAAFVRQFCAAPGGSGLIGITLGPDRAPLPGLEVQIRWSSETGAPREERRRSGPGGLFAFCDLPSNRLLPMRLIQDQQGLSERNVRLAAGEFRWVELEP